MVDLAKTVIAGYLLVAGTCSAIVAFFAALLARARRVAPAPCEPDCVMCALAADSFTPAPIEATV